MTITELIANLQQWDQEHPDAEICFDAQDGVYYPAQVDYKPETNTVWIW